MIVVEEGWRAYGIGAEIATRVTETAFDYLDAPIRRVAQAEVPLPYNRRLEQMALPQMEDVIQAVKDVLYL
jgi:pyruvate dehydrogenase E1 component beta subunit